MLEIKPSPLEEQIILLTVELFLQPPSEIVFLILISTLTIIAAFSASVLLQI